MGLMPELLPGYQPSQTFGLTWADMLANEDLGALWVIGANPLKNAELRAKNAFVVVQEMFLTETAQIANVVLPAASAYEKWGTVTNVCGEVQRLKKAIQTMGAKPDLEIIKPEMSVKVSFLEAAPTGTETQGVTVPKSAIRTEGNESYVWTVHDGTVRRVGISIERETETGVEVSQGLKNGDMVVTTPQVNLSDGTKVSIGGE